MESYREKLESSGNVALSIVHEPDEGLFVDWRPFLGHDWQASGDTTFEAVKLQNIAHRMEAIPDGFAVHKQVQKIIEDRHKMAAGAMPINWGFAEVMAYATLTEEGYPIRLTGQDVGVGTFSHRHAALHNQRDGKRIIPINLLREDTTFDIYDSLLSEEAVLAFEYGYASTAPDTMVIWEAQFGDLSLIHI